jgi:hypothetical protein
MSLHFPSKALRVTGTAGPSRAQTPDGQDPWLTRHRPTTLLGRAHCVNCRWPYPCPTRRAHTDRRAR